MSIFPLRQCAAPLEDAQVVEEELAIEMIDLVLHAAREQLGAFGLELVAVFVERADDDPFRTASTSPNMSGIERQPSSPRAVPSRSMISGLMSANFCPSTSITAMRSVPADLRRGEADASAAYIVSNMSAMRRADLVRDFRDGCGRLSKHRVAEDPDVEDLHPSTTSRRAGAPDDSRNAAALDDEARLSALDGDAVFERRRLAVFGGRSLLDVNHFADDSAGGDDLVAALDLANERVLCLALLLAGADEEEVEDGEDRAIHENRAEQLRSWEA